MKADRSIQKKRNTLQQGNGVEDEVEENDKLMDITQTKYLKTRRVKDIYVCFPAYLHKFVYKIQ